MSQNHIHPQSTGAQRQLSLVCGNAGVGKTTFGARLAQQTAACLLDIDTVSEKLVQAGLAALGMDTNDRDSLAYKSFYREAIHETLFDIAAQNLRHCPCVIVAPFTQERREPNFLSRVQNHFRCDVQIYYLVCTEAVRKRRILARGNPRDASKLLDWDAYSDLGQDSVLPPFQHILIRTDQVDA